MENMDRRTFVTLLTGAMLAVKCGEEPDKLYGPDTVVADQEEAADAATDTTTDTGADGAEDGVDDVDGADATTSDGADEITNPDGDAEDGADAKDNVECVETTAKAKSAKFTSENGTYKGPFASGYADEIYNKTGPVSQKAISENETYYNQEIAINQANKSSLIVAFVPEKYTKISTQKISNIGSIKGVGGYDVYKCAIDPNNFDFETGADTKTAMAVLAETIMNPDNHDNDLKKALKTLPGISNVEKITVPLVKVPEGTAEPYDFGTEQITNNVLFIFVMPTEIKTNPCDLARNGTRRDFLKIDKLLRLA